MFYTRHLFFCTNKKADETGCGFLGGEEAFVIAKKHIQALAIWGEGKCRASKSGCLGRCESGPVCVVYPDGCWYTYVDEADIKEIINEHLVLGRQVERLRI